MLIPVILSGGSGSRLWPLSRAAYPKQFLSLLSEHSLLGDTLARVDGAPDVGAPVIVANEAHRFIVASELQRRGQLQDATIILEPCARNTAPAIASAAHAVVTHNEEAIMLVLPADHSIPDVASFQKAVAHGVEAAKQGFLVTFGVVPTMAHTGYGYIRAGQEKGATAWQPICEFVEKPDAATAKRYLDNGLYYWNSGMFLFQARDFLEQLAHFEPEMVQCTRQSLQGARGDLDFTRLEPEAFAASKSISVDYAVMEHTQKGVVVPLDAGWSDVGSWNSLWEVAHKDAYRNATRGDVLLQDTVGCYVHAESRLVATLGVQDHVIVETPDAVLVAEKGRVEEVKKIVTSLQKAERSEYEVHRRRYRPWGSYEVMLETERFLVKRIQVQPGHTIAQQMHHHRAEHWIIVKGTALIHRGEEELLLSEDQSTYLPLGMKHTLHNPGLVPLELIEVQTGSYIAEDDVVRFGEDE